jgi:DNA primase
VTSKEKVKELLINDKDKVVYILEELGCHKINPNFSRNEIRCALPDGETNTSVSVKMESYLPCQVFSRGAWDDYETKDFITLVQFIKGLSFNDSVKWLCMKLNIDYSNSDFENNTLDIVHELRKLKRREHYQDYNIEHQKLSSTILKQYRPCVVSDWIKEGISATSQKKFGIHNDERGMRWIIPIYDENNNLISLKARTYSPNWEEMGITKYVYYYKLKGNDILFGLNFNKNSIQEHNEIILFEAEKSVMAADSYGYDWSSAIGTNGINKYLRKKILALKCSNCVIALDKDVGYKEVLKEARKLSKDMNVYIVFDKNGLLKGKQSPIDNGKETWEILYNNRIRVR